MDRQHDEIKVRIAAFMISSFEPLPGSVRNDGRALVKKGVVHPQLVESPLHPILKRLAGDRLDHRRQERETVRCVVELLACLYKSNFFSNLTITMC